MTVWPDNQREISARLITQAVQVFCYLVHRDVVNCDITITSCLQKHYDMEMSIHPPREQHRKASDL